ncbi:MAG TPA: sigma-70 family RNA polymerase sigma factor [Cyclobacteriaceae bacterium]
MILTKPDIDRERTLIDEAKQDPAAFRPLYEQYFKLVFLFVLRRTNDKDLASDITSQIFLKALQGIGRYNHQGIPFSAWLYRIAINEVNLFFRKQKRDRFVSIDTDQLINLHEELTKDLSIDHLQNLLPEMLQKLDLNELQLIELRFFEQLSFKEIAKIFGITEVHAKVKVYRILDKLRKYFKNEKQN